VKVYKKLVGEIHAIYLKKDKHNAVKISRSEDVNIYVREFFPVEIELREAFLCLYLNRANNTLGYAIISIGGISGTFCDPKIIFQYGLLCNASSLILIHNHPSGNVTPSETDKRLTQKIKSIGELMDMLIHDHIIISPTDNKYFSFADEGIL
jgi:DNA repair protein RadC